MNAQEVSNLPHVSNIHAVRRTVAPDSTIYTSKIVEWDKQKGFGFLLHQKKKLFLHHRDFAEKHKRPAVGDKVHYKVGSDPRGRTCAIEAVHVNDGGKLTFGNWITVLFLLLLPLCAANRLALRTDEPTLYFLGGCALFLFGNYIAFQAYKVDKERAREKEWRISENTLHRWSLLGGWPAAFLAQRKYRHKCSKEGFQLKFWLIVIAYQYITLDFLLNWQISSQFLNT